MPDHTRPGGETPPIAPVAELRPALTDIEGARRYLGGISRALQQPDHQFGFDLALQVRAGS